MSIYVVNLTEMNDRTLKSAMNSVPEESIILFEDIDCMKAGNRRPGLPSAKAAQLVTAPGDAGAAPDRGVVSLSGLLNVLDGFHAPSNVVFVMTTNAIDTLDPALLRPGRIDYKLYLGEADESQKCELYRRFFPDATEDDAKVFVESHVVETMAEFQGLLLAIEQEAPVLEVIG